MPYRQSSNPVIQQRIELFGVALRMWRGRRGFSQERLEELSGVDQTSISRAERGLAPGFSFERLARLSIVLGPSMVGFCPHEHACVWQAPPQPKLRWWSLSVPAELAYAATMATDPFDPADPTAGGHAPTGLVEVDFDSDGAEEDIDVAGDLASLWQPEGRSTNTP